MSNSVNIVSVPSVVNPNGAGDAGVASSNEAASRHQEFSQVLQSSEQRKASARSDEMPKQTSARHKTPSSSAVLSQAGKSADTPVARKKSADKPTAEVNLGQSNSGRPKLGKAESTDIVADDEHHEQEHRDEPLSDSAAQVLLMMGLPTQSPVVPVSTTPVAVATGTVSSAIVGTGAVVTDCNASNIPPLISGTPTTATAIAAAQLNAQPDAQSQPAASVTNANTSVPDSKASSPPTQDTNLNNSVSSLLTRPVDSSVLPQLTALQAQLISAQDGKHRMDENVATRSPSELLTALDGVMGGLNSLADTQGIKDIAASQGNATQVIASPVGTAEWVPELASKLLVLARHDVSKATLYVTPNDLGPIRVQIETQQNQTNVWFTADHPDTRSAIEQSLPKLRELFMTQGMTLNDAGVFSGSSGQQATPQSPRFWPAASAELQPELADTVTVKTLSLKLVDAYV